MVKLAIVILNWNGKKFLEKFLPVLTAHIPDYSEIVVIDNNSTDHSREFLQEKYPQLRLIVNASNGGFSRGYNEGLQQIEAKYYCLLNSDIEVPAFWVEPIIEQMEQDDQIAIVQPKILSFAERNRFEYAGAAGGFIDKLGYPFCRGRLFETLEIDNGQYDTSMEIFWATGAAMFVRSDIYHQLGGLDEDFFAHMEEIDFCWRAKNLGYKVMINPQSTVFHVGGGTLPKNNSLKTFLNFRNNLFLLLKNLPYNKIFLTFILRWALDQLAAFVFLMRGNRKDFIAVYKAWGAFLLNYKKMRRKREGNHQLAYRKMCKTLIIFQYNIRKKRHFNGKTFF